MHPCALMMIMTIVLVVVQTIGVFVTVSFNIRNMML